ncbi:MAG: hypothetical protein D6766_08890 [Verrucomicrobia bacterium]|nr:MAG: hypothetical protein D6766_08890 [Verrucomicrobiota bacterium]
MIASIHAKLPQEYLEMVAQGAPRCINDWQVYAPQQIWKHPGADGHNYYLLEEKDAVGWVCVQEDDESGEIYLLDYDDASAERIRCGFRDFLKGDGTAS